MCDTFHMSAEYHVRRAPSKVAKELIKKDTDITDGLLNRIEMAFRAYDPCFACATHSLPGQMPLEVTIRDKDGNLLSNFRR